MPDEPKVKALSDDLGCCAHQRIEWWQNSETKVTACGWKCRDCGSAFVPSIVLEQQLAAERERLKNQSYTILEYQSDNTALTAQLEQLSREIASLRESNIDLIAREAEASFKVKSARVCDCWVASLQSSRPYKGCPHCTNGVRFDVKEKL